MIKVSATAPEPSYRLPDTGIVGLDFTSPSTYGPVLYVRLQGREPETQSFDANFQYPGLPDWPVPPPLSQ